MRTSTPLIAGGAFALIALPLSAFAATTDFFGPIIPQDAKAYCAGSAFDWGGVLQVSQNVLNVIDSVAVLAVVFFFAWAGFTLITSGANPAGRTQAKNRMLNAMLGLVLILGSWLIVDTIMKVLYNPSTTFNGTTFGPWNKILAGDPSAYCLKPNLHPGILSDGTVNGGLVSTAKGVLNPGTANSSTAGGVCTVQTSGFCASSNFTSAFGGAANAASQICSAESSNGLLLQGDKTTSGAPVSFGVFQINITAHPVAGLNCPTAFDSVFTGSHHNVNIINPTLYSQCKAAALVTANNAAVAASIYTKDGDSWREWSTAGKCGLR